MLLAILRMIIKADFNTVETTLYCSSNANPVALTWSGKTSYRCANATKLILNDPDGHMNTLFKHCQTSRVGITLKVNEKYRVPFSLCGDEMNLRFVVEENYRSYQLEFKTQSLELSPKDRVFISFTKQ